MGRGSSGSITECPGCHLRLPGRDPGLPQGANASAGCLKLYSDLLAYSVARQDPGFIHQHVVDTYAAQHAGGSTRPIAVVFGLIGLYLALERGYSGREVQRAHVRFARAGRRWSPLDPPACPAVLTVRDVLEAGSDEEKDAMIHRWMAAVWASWAQRHAWVRDTTATLFGESGR